MHDSPGVYITRYNVAGLTSIPYARAVSPVNIMNAFRKAGIYTFDSDTNCTLINLSYTPEHLTSLLPSTKVNHYHQLKAKRQAVFLKAERSL